MALRKWFRVLVGGLLTTQWLCLYHLSLGESLGKTGTWSCKGVKTALYRLGSDATPKILSHNFLRVPTTIMHVGMNHGGFVMFPTTRWQPAHY